MFLQFSFLYSIGAYIFVWMKHNAQCTIYILESSTDLFLVILVEVKNANSSPVTYNIKYYAAFCCRIFFS